MDEVVETLKRANSTLNDAISTVEAYLKAKMACLQILEQQMAAIENEKVAKVADVEGQSEEHVFNPDPVKMALEIPLILEMILENMDFKSLMSSRRVSKYWNEAAVTVFSKTPTNEETSKRLNLEKLFESSDFNPFPEIEPKLTKRICYSVGNCISEDPYYQGQVFVSKQKLLMFCQKFSDQIEEMDFHISPSFALPFLRAITNQCPNLKSLILDCYNFPQAQEADLVEMEAMPQEELFRVNLNKIEFNNFSNIQPKFFSVPLQRIIDRAPNLARLTLPANFYPNLINNKNLRILCFGGQVNKPNFSLTKLSEMLDQVKNSVEAIKIWTRRQESPNSQGFSFPVMKVLKKLVIWDIILHPLEQDGRSIIKTIASKFPNLEHLEIESTKANDMDTMLNKAIQGPPIRLCKIQTLIVNKFQNPSVLALFSSCFPNLKKLEISMPENGDISAVLSALGGLKLKHFSLAMNFCFQFSDLVKALDANPELFKGLGILEICANDEEILQIDDLRFEARQLFCEWLRSTKGNIKSVTFKDFMFSGATALEVMPVIRNHQLPVHFINT